jgi:hypothetical protein
MVKLCVLVLIASLIVRYSRRGERKRVPRAGAWSRVLRAGARDPEPLAGTPQGLRRLQVQSHPLMHALVLVL